MTSSDGFWRLDVPSERRSLMLCAIGAVAGLAIAGMGLFTAQGTRTQGVAAENVATVNGVPILMVDYLTHLRALFDTSLTDATPAQKRRVLDDMIREELFVQRGVELGVQTDTTEVRVEMVGAVEAKTAADATAAVPSEVELRTHYERNRAKFDGEGVMTVAEYLAPAGQDAAAAVRDLRANGATDAVLQRHGLQRSDRMNDGEEYYFAARIHLGDQLFQQARALPDGGVSDAIAIEGRPHILVMQSNRPPVPPPFDAIRDRVVADYVDQHQKTLIAGTERFLRKRADIQVQDGFE